MHFNKIEVNHNLAAHFRRGESLLNQAVRGYDDLLAKLRLGGRKAHYDDGAYEFMGGARDALRKKHYDKSLRLLWKAEDKAPWLDFRDETPTERSVYELALRDLTEEEKELRKRLTMPEYKAMIEREYTKRERQAIVHILSAIGHGEAYAWLVSAELLGMVKSTGARAALTMQVLEEAKHFVVLRELIRAFGEPVPRQSVSEYLLLEAVLKAKGMEKFFGMNVVVEGIALSLFGMMCELPGLEVLRVFHLDESRHTALPQNYFKEFPLGEWQRRNPIARLKRLQLIVPALGLIPMLEEHLAELGIDALAFGGSVIRKIGHLAERNGFLLPVPMTQLYGVFNSLFNTYAKVTRPTHRWQAYMSSDTTRGEEQLAVEREAFA